MYYGLNTQTGYNTIARMNFWDVIESVEALGWEDSEWVLMEGLDNPEPVEFLCTYSFHYGEEHYTCELTSNRPDAYCEVHSA